MRIASEDAQESAIEAFWSGAPACRLKESEPNGWRRCLELDLRGHLLVPAGPLFPGNAAPLTREIRGSSPCADRRPVRDHYKTRCIPPVTDVKATSTTRWRCSTTPRPVHVTRSPFTFALLLVTVVFAAATIPLLPPVLAGIATAVMTLTSILIGLFGRQLLGSV